MCPRAVTRAAWQEGRGLEMVLKRWVGLCLDMTSLPRQSPFFFPPCFLASCSIGLARSFLRKLCECMCLCSKMCAFSNKIKKLFKILSFWYLWISRLYYLFVSCMYVQCSDHHCVQRWAQVPWKTRHRNLLSWQEGVGVCRKYFEEVVAVPEINCCFILFSFSPEAES